MVVSLEIVDETTSNALFFCCQNLALISLATSGPQALTAYYYLDFIIPQQLAVLKACLPLCFLPHPVNIEFLGHPLSPHPYTVFPSVLARPESHVLSSH